MVRFRANHIAASLEATRAGCRGRWWGATPSRRGLPAKLDRAEFRRFPAPTCVRLPQEGREPAWPTPSQRPSAAAPQRRSAAAPSAERGAAGAGGRSAKPSRDEGVREADPRGHRARRDRCVRHDGHPPGRCRGHHLRVQDAAAPPPAAAGGRWLSGRHAVRHGEADGSSEYRAPHAISRQRCVCR